MAFDSKITNADLTDKGVTGLPDVPNLTTLQMQQKFDELCKDVIIPKFNALINELESDGSLEMFGTEETGASKIGAKDGTLLSTVQDCLDALKELAHSHDNKDALDDVTAGMISDISNVCQMLRGITAVSTSVSNSDALIPTCKAIVDYVQVLGAGDMLKAVYDADNNGIVDNAEALNGHADTYFQKATDNTLATTDKTTTGAINEVKANVGDLSDLDTTDKTDLVSAVNEVKASAYPMIANETELMANTTSGKVADSLIVKQLNSNLSTNSIPFVFDYQNGKYGYNTDASRGADTFHPFSGGVAKIIAKFGTLAGQPIVYLQLIDNTNNIICNTVGASQNGSGTGYCAQTSYADFEYVSGGSTRIYIKTNCDVSINGGASTQYENGDIITGAYNDNKTYTISL